MSHWQGSIHDKGTGELVGYFEYNGTVDIALPAIFDTSDELCAAWRQHGFERQCSCTDGLRDVTIRYSYLDEQPVCEWAGKMCPVHKCIAKGYTDDPALR